VGGGGDTPSPEPNPGTETETANPALAKNWAELPAATEGNNLVTAWYRATTSGPRNYSMLFDTGTYPAYWVAYPLTAADIANNPGSSYNDKRPSWRINPDFNSSTEQINVWSGSYGGDGTYSRGHQIPDADRSGNDGRLVQAYYATNSTPQIQNGFNGGIWSSLEGAVRGAIPSADTLYVVTGAILQTAGGNEQINKIKPASDTKQCPVPNYYYKVLMKCRRAGDGTITSASTVGVWLEHKVYGGDGWSNYTMSVAEIEAKTGYDFFTNLPDAIESTAESNSDWKTFTEF
jgi:endonuclease G